MPLALLLGVFHAFTDAATVTVALRATSSSLLTPATVFAGILAYDLIAFGLQPLLGWAQDRWANPRAAMLAGLGLTLAGVVVVQTGTHPATAQVLLAVVLAALGNAAYHLGAGAAVLRQGLDRSAPAGLLVAPGALGLAFGLWFGKDPSHGPVWLIGVPVVLALVVVTRIALPALRTRLTARNVLGRPVTDIVIGALALLMISIAIRALVGSAASRGYQSGTWLMLGLPLVAFSGKLLGGLLADRLGWTLTTVAALGLSAPLLAFTYPHPAMLLAGLLVFQMTMPVTLVAIARLMPARLATGFGLTCLALIAGALPAMFAWGADLCSRPLLGAWVLLSALAAWAGLTLSGLHWRFPRPDDDVARSRSVATVTAGR